MESCDVGYLDDDRLQCVAFSCIGRHEHANNRLQNYSLKTTTHSITNGYPQLTCSAPLPYVVAPHLHPLVADVRIQYRNSFAPWVYPSLPPNPTLQHQYTRPAQIISHFNMPNESTQTAPQSPYLVADHAPNPLPIFPNFTYLGKPLAISAPLVSHAATLIYFARLQARPMYMNQTDPMILSENVGHTEPQTPTDFWLQELTRRDSSGVSSIATADLDRVAGARSYAPPFVHMRLPSLARSVSWDDDVLRMMTCRDPSIGARMYKELGAPQYRWKKGSLNGAWDGRFLVRISVCMFVARTESHLVSRRLGTTMLICKS